MLDTSTQKQAYLKHLVSKYPLKALHNMVETLKTVHTLAKEEQATLYKQLGYKPVYGGVYNIQDTPFLDKLDVINDKLNRCSALMDIVSRAVLEKVSL